MIKRYRFPHIPLGGFYCVDVDAESDTYVLASDYDALLARCKELEAVIVSSQMACDDANKLSWRAHNAEARIAKLEQALRGLLCDDPEMDCMGCEECDGSEEDCKIAEGGTICYWRADIYRARAALVQPNHLTNHLIEGTDK